MSFGSDIGRSTGRTPLDEWDMRFVPGARYVSDDEIRRAIAIAQAMDEASSGNLDDVHAAVVLERIGDRAAELLDAKP